LRRHLDGLADETARKVRRLILAYGESAVARLVELMQGDSAETARKAAVDLLRHWQGCLQDERADASRAESVARRQAADRLSDEQVERVWAILADAASYDAEESHNDDDSVDGE